MAVEQIYPNDTRCDKWNVKNHTERYRFACKFQDGAKKTALDVCCGTGYGADMLREIGYYVDAFDRSPEAIAFAMENYPLVHYRLQDALREWSTFRKREKKYNLITFFEALEHFNKSNGIKILKKIKKHLADNGAVILSIPRDARLKFNPFHLYDWSLDELKKTLTEIFDNVKIKEQDGFTSEISDKVENLTYYIAICFNHKNAKSKRDHR